MDLVKFNQNDFGHLPSFFEDFFGRDFFGGFPKTSFPAVNVKENEDKYVVFMAAPGLSKEDFSISVDNNVLQIFSEKKQENEEKGKDGKFTRREYHYNKLSRSFRLPENVNPDEIQAKYENGELVIQIPKKNVTVTPVKQIMVE